MGRKRPASCMKIFLWAVLGLPGLCLVLTVVSFLVNQRAPQASEVVEHLSTLDKARLAEADHLRWAVGDDVFPGWGQAEIPFVVYNEEYAFLVGMRETPDDGWYKIPRGSQRGIAWEQVPGDEFFGQPYYRQRLLDPNTTPEAFTVQVGEQWAASLTTYDWMKIKLAQEFRQDLPAFLRPVFPYGLAVNLLLTGSDFYTVALLHEAAHAYQGIQAVQRLEEGERAISELRQRYPWFEDAHHAAWKEELGLLKDAAQAASPEQAREIARQFLRQRQNRRQDARLSGQLIDLERKREWEEGLAKYAELNVYRLAAAPGYTPFNDVLDDPDFKRYAGYNRRWQNEINQIARSSSSDDVRFYYSGMAQALLLDQLAPGWKDRLFEDDVWLEDLLAEAVR
jgi:hypothetical protein